MSTVKFTLAVCCLAIASCAASSPAELSPPQAVLAAAERPEGITGAFRMEVRGGGRKDGWLYLDSEADYRDQRCLCVEASPEVARELESVLQGDPVAVLKGKTIIVQGTARRTTIWFFVGGRKTDKYYYQTHVPLTSASALRVVP